MIISLIDIENGVIIPSVHCYNLKKLKAVKEAYPENHIKVYSYLFYMTCPNPEINPFFNTPEETKEELILVEVGVDFSTEDTVVQEALALCHTLYETPTLRAFNGIKSMLDRLATYMGSTSISHGRDGNLTALINAASKYNEVRDAYKGAYKDLMEEQKGSARGGSFTAYDQK